MASKMLKISPSEVLVFRPAEKERHLKRSIKNLSDTLAVSYAIVIRPPMDNYFKVEPMAGMLKPSEEQQLYVTLFPDDMADKPLSAMEKVPSTYGISIIATKEKCEPDEFQRVNLTAVIEDEIQKAPDLVSVKSEEEMKKFHDLEVVREEIEVEVHASNRDGMVRDKSVENILDELERAADDAPVTVGGAVGDPFAAFGATKDPSISSQKSEQSEKGIMMAGTTEYNKSLSSKSQGKDCEAPGEKSSIKLSREGSRASQKSDKQAVKCEAVAYNKSISSSSKGKPDETEKQKSVERTASMKSSTSEKAPSRTHSVRSNKSSKEETVESHVERRESIKSNKAQNDHQLEEKQEKAPSRNNSVKSNKSNKEETGESNLERRESIKSNKAQNDDQNDGKSEKPVSRRESLKSSKSHHDEENKHENEDHVERKESIKSSKSKNSTQEETWEKVKAGNQQATVVSSTSQQGGYHNEKDTSEASEKAVSFKDTKSTTQNEITDNNQKPANDDDKFLSRTPSIHSKGSGIVENGDDHDGENKMGRTPSQKSNKSATEETKGMKTHSRNQSIHSAKSLHEEKSCTNKEEECTKEVAGEQESAKPISRTPSNRSAQGQDGVKSAGRSESVKSEVENKDVLKSTSRSNSHHSAQKEEEKAQDKVPSRSPSMKSEKSTHDEKQPSRTNSIKSNKSEHKEEPELTRTPSVRSSKSTKEEHEHVHHSEEKQPASRTESVKSSRSTSGEGQSNSYNVASDQNGAAEAKHSDPTNIVSEETSQEERQIGEPSERGEKMKKDGGTVRRLKSYNRRLLDQVEELRHENEDLKKAKEKLRDDMMSVDPKLPVGTFEMV